ncbi:MAG: thioredoxin [Deltaproteobacteria bacterium]|nr:thioredoxin [Deltaproteobacteria bacterium]
MHKKKEKRKESNMNKAKTLTDSEFKTEVLEANLPVLVDFWASWCGPCQIMGPIIDKIAEEYEGKVKVCKLNVDENPKTPAAYGIRAIPTIILFNNGEVVEKIVGAQPKSAIENLIKRVL